MNEVEQYQERVAKGFDPPFIVIRGRMNPNFLEADGTIDYGVHDGSGKVAVRVARVATGKDQRGNFVRFEGIAVDRDSHNPDITDADIARDLLGDVMR